ncbi:MAG: DUF3870 domain-containing protein [Synergistaceae bacterium]|nr:DUF3870 domain-containing protein [Synergistaceae bacterium]
MTYEGEYPENSILVVGNSQTTGFNPINQQFGSFFITFILLKETGEIIDCGVSVTLGVTACFLRGILLGKFILEDEEKIIAEVQSRYFGSSQKALIAAYRDAMKKYREVMSERKAIK